ncbi:MAG: ATP-dependent Clp protease adaptor ClpS [Phycisphaerales bacterium]|nr:ATP-dependent Clp protease adaptor ClpS [Phycisphaerales bacterium]
MPQATESAPQTTQTTQATVAPMPMRAGPLGPWAVIVHNDNLNTFDFVIRCLREIARLEMNTAIEKTNEIHYQGASPVTCTHREHAELISERLQGRGLTVTIEPA